MLTRLNTELRLHSLPQPARGDLRRHDLGPDTVQVDFSRTRRLGANLDLADGWSEVASSTAVPDPWRTAAERLETEVRWNTGEQTFVGRDRAGTEVSVRLGENTESLREERMRNRVDKYTADLGPEEGRQRFLQRSDAAARAYEGHGLVRVDRPGDGWARYPADPLNCRGDALRPWTHGDHFVDDASAGRLMNALGAQDVSQEQARLGDLVGFDVHGRPGEADYKVGHLATVVGHDRDGHPLVGGRDGEYGVWMGRMDDWQRALPGQAQVYHIPQGARLERR